jgi:acetyl esterase
MTSSVPADQPGSTGPRVADLQLRGSTGPLRTRVDWPAPAGGTGPPPLLVFLPSERDNGLGSTLALLAGVVVLAVTDTRPTLLSDAAALAEATTATQWAADHAAELDADPQRVVVGGEGRGAWLAAAVALQARDDGWPTLARQLLVVPAPSTRDGSAAAHLVAPRRAPSLVGVAPATVLTVGDGPRGIELRRYVSRLRGAGVGVDDVPDPVPVPGVAAHLASALRRAVGGAGGRSA